MNKKKLGLYLGMLILLVVSVVIRGEEWKKEKPEYIFMTNSTRNYEDFRMFQEFEKTVENAGGIPKILEFEDPKLSSIQQLQTLKKNVKENTKAIIVNAANNSSLTELLEEYREKGISIISCMSEVEARNRDLHIGPADPAAFGKNLMKETIKICQGKGKFAIISGSARTESATTLMMEIRYTFEEEANGQMILSDVLYGDENVEKAMENICSYLEKTSDVKVLICLSERMTEAACKAIMQMKMEEKVTVLGMGNPVFFQKVLEEEKLKLQLYYYDMAEFGKWAAEVALRMSNGEIAGTAGECTEINEKIYCVVNDTTMGGDDRDGTVMYCYPKYQSKGSIRNAEFD